MKKEKNKKDEIEVEEEVVRELMPVPEPPKEKKPMFVI